MLSAKKSLSPHTAAKIAQKLLSSSVEQEFFQTLVLLSTAKSAALRSQYAERAARIMCIKTNFR